MEDGNSPVEPDGWGPFGAPLFDDPKVRDLSRVGVIDVGSNSVRMVVFDGAARSPAYFYNEKIMCGLGRGVAETGVLNPDGEARALAAIRRFALIAKSLNVSPLSAVATAAVREARNGPAFAETVRDQTGLELNVIEGAEEARLSAQGVLLGWPRAEGLMCDIGGSSMELAEVHNGNVGACRSAQLGPLKLASVKGGRKARQVLIDDTLAEMKTAFAQNYRRLYLVGGSWRAIARIDMERRAYPLHVLHEYTMGPREIRDTAKYIALQDLETLRRRCRLSEARISLVPIACEVLLRLLSTFKPEQIAISSYGIREGMLYEQMPDKLRARDPLIEACRFAERKDARLPGFGRTLNAFIAPLFPKVSDERKRLIKAACLLHDVSWRAHPDYRGEICFDNATRANLGGLGHKDRAYLAFALLNRYRSRSADPRFQGAASLLSDADMREAEVVGKAMRFGAMFSASDKSLLGGLSWQPRKKVLTLTLPDGPGRDLYGEVAEARLASLGRSLDAEITVI